MAEKARAIQVSAYCIICPCKRSQLRLDCPFYEEPVTCEHCGRELDVSSVKYQNGAVMKKYDEDVTPTRS